MINTPFALQSRSITESDFQTRRKEVIDFLYASPDPNAFFSRNLKTSDPLLSELGARERANRLGLLSVWNSVLCSLQLFTVWFVPCLDHYLHKVSGKAWRNIRLHRLRTSTFTGQQEQKECLWLESNLHRKTKTLSHQARSFLLQLYDRQGLKTKL